MSYDLFFTPRNENANLTAASFAGFFKQRKNYEVTESQAIYQNEDTDVVFIFDLDAEEGEGVLSLNLNYWRPHVFGLEADAELSVLVRELDLGVDDPQGVMEDGVYSSEGFLRGWNDGNALAYRSFVNDKEMDSYFTAPTAKIDSAWRWNFTRGALQEQLGEDIFVPKIMWADKQGVAETMIVWGDAICTLIPRVDNVLIMREELAPKKLFRKQPDASLTPWNEIEPLLAEFPVEQGSSLPYHVLRYAEAPAHIVEFFKARKATKGDILSMDMVLNAELVEKSKKA